MPRRPAGRGAAPPRCSQRHWRCEQRLLRDYLSQRDAVPARWRDADLASSYTLRVSPSELAALGEQLDALIRPLIAAVRVSVPKDAALVNLDLFAFPRLEAPWRPAEP